MSAAGPPSAIDPAEGTTSADCASVDRGDTAAWEASNGPPCTALRSIALPAGHATSARRTAPHTRNDPRPPRVVDHRTGRLSLPTQGRSSCASSLVVGAEAIREWYRQATQFVATREPAKLPTPPAKPRSSMGSPVSNWTVTRWGRRILSDLADAFAGWVAAALAAPPLTQEGAKNDPH